MAAAVRMRKRIVAAMVQFWDGAVPPVVMNLSESAGQGVGVGWTPNLAGAIVAGRSERVAQSLSPSVGSVNALLVNTAMLLDSSWGSLTKLTMSMRLRNFCGNGTHAWIGWLNLYASS